MTEQNGLSAREIEILQLVKRGLTNREIAEQLSLSLHTVKWYLKQLYSKLDVGSRTQAVAKVKTLIEQPTPSAPKTNLPAAVKAFFGREEALQDLFAWLTDKNIRLVTIHGMGGIGKSRLAVQVGRRMLPYFQDGVYQLTLAPLSTPHQALTALADAVQMPYSGGDVQTELAHYLRAKQMLLIIDNAENLDLTDTIAQILGAAPQLTCLVTSRKRLNMQAEHVYTLTGLDTPTPSTKNPEACSAVQHFMARARTVNVHLENLSDVAQICQQLGGVPLAIELAAAWVDILPLADIREALSQNLDLLITDATDLPARHRSMRAILDHSWQMLTEDEQCAASYLAVMGDAFTTEAALAVADTNLLTLRRLVSKAFLQQELDSLRLHELMQQYLLERAPSEAAHDAHMRYFLDLVHQQESLFADGHISQGIAIINQHHKNILKAWQWAVQHAEWDLLNDALILIAYYHFKAWWYDGEQLLIQVLESAPPGHILSQRTKILRGLYNFAMSNFLQAKQILDSVTLVEDTEYIALADSIRGLLHIATGDPAGGWQYLEAANERAQNIKHLYFYTWIETLYGHAKMRTGDYATASTIYELLVAKYPERETAADILLLQLAHCYLALRQTDEAERLFQSAFERGIETYNHQLTTESFYYIHNAPYPKLFAKALELAEIMGTVGVVASSFRLGASSAASRGDPLAAWDMHWLSLRLYLHDDNYRQLMAGLLAVVDYTQIRKEEVLTRQVVELMSQLPYSYFTTRVTMLREQFGIGPTNAYLNDPDAISEKLDALFLTVE